MYMEACQRKGQKLDPQIVSYFNDCNLAEVVFKDKYLNEEHKII